MQGRLEHRSTRVWASLVVVAWVALILLWAYYAFAGTHRSWRAKHQFEVMTGWPKGRPGYVVDHVIPLAAPCYGSDDPSNMQWESIADAKSKDRWERKECRLINGREEGCCL